MQSLVRHVYVHVPFCARKCPYCDFNSYAGRQADEAPYVAALLEEARSRVRGVEPTTLYVGGGTPTLLEAGRLEDLLVGLRGIVGDGRLEEFTVEANPGTVDRETARALRRAGVGRISLGAQSFEDHHLRTLGRIHRARDTVRSVDLLREEGIEHLSLDLILAVVGADLDDLMRDLECALALEPEHVSAYVLTIEEGTPFHRMVREGRLPACDGERELAHLHAAVERLEAAGHRRYEISNFTRDGAVCRHNLAYWRDRDWVGLGAGAHSHDGARRMGNVRDPAAYARHVAEAGDAISWVETSPPLVRLFDALMMGLRLIEGVDLDEAAERTGCDARTAWPEALERHLEEGLLVLDDARLRLSPRGLDLASWVLRDLLPDVAPTVEVRIAETA
ncbi:MAG: radical SAM family heme chaperone HemW [Planctomycetota bacterium]